jgi:hypothetical protein
MQIKNIITKLIIPKVGKTNANPTNNNKVINIIKMPSDNDISVLVFELLCIGFDIGFPLL